MTTGAAAGVQPVVMRGDGPSVIATLTGRYCWLGQIFRLGYKSMPDASGERNWRFLVILWTVIGSVGGSVGWGGVEIGTLREQIRQTQEQIKQTQDWQIKRDTNGGKEEFAVIKQQVHDLGPRVATLEEKMGSIEMHMSRIEEVVSGTNKMVERWIIEHPGGGK